jgi:hypothetical protein
MSTFEDESRCTNGYVRVVDLLFLAFLTTFCINPCFDSGLQNKITSQSAKSSALLISMVLIKG